MASCLTVAATPTARALPNLLRCAVLLEQVCDLLLLRLRLWRPTAAATGVQGSEPHWRRAALVPASNIGAAIEKGTNGGGATSAHSTV